MAVKPLPINKLCFVLLIKINCLQLLTGSTTWISSIAPGAIFTDSYELLNGAKIWECESPLGPILFSDNNFPVFPLYSLIQWILSIISLFCGNSAKIENDLKSCLRFSNFSFWFQRRQGIDLIGRVDNSLNKILKNIIN